jgi:hypothetical protein
MLYGIINPGDPYTMEAEDPEIATAACLLLGDGAYGLEDEHGDSVEDCPMLRFMPADRARGWVAERYGDQGLAGYAKANREAVRACLRSVLIGDFEDRKLMARVLGAISDPADRAKAEFEWHDSRRSSMNDIGASAAKLVAWLESEAAP